MSRNRGRQQASKPIRPRVVIACEGEETERRYFEGIRQDLRLSDTRIKVVRTRGTDPLTIVESAIKGRSEVARDDRWASEDTAYAVFDGDEHFRKDPNNCHKAIHLARGQQVVLAISNPCIELWFLLHFQDQSAALDARSAQTRLKKHIPDYEKPRQIYQSHLRARTSAAIARARQLIAWHEPSASSCPPNPSTGVADLVEKLLSLERIR